MGLLGNLILGYEIKQMGALDSNREIIKILHANDDNVNLGGAFIITYRVEKYLREFGYSYDYITMDHFVRNNKAYPISEDDKLYSANLRNNRLIGHLRLPFYVGRVVKQEKYPLIHIDTDSAWKALLYAIPCHMNGVKVLVHSHSTGIDGDVRILKCSIEYIAKIILLFFTDRYIACSTKAAVWILPKHSRKKVDLLFNGVDYNSFFFDYETRGRIREKLELKNKTVIGNIGVLSENKNQLYLIDLLLNLKSSNENVVLLLVGNDKTTYAEIIKRKVFELGLDNNVVFTGNTQDIRELLCAMDIYIQPSRFEGLPLVVIEAQATGLPCYVSLGVPDDVIVSEWCFKFDINANINETANDIMSCVQQWNDNRAERQLEEKYSIREMAKKESAIYGEILAGE